jgi:hypothetical protein
VADWSEQDFEGYQTRDEAERGHAAMVAKWVNRTAVAAS